MTARTGRRQVPATTTGSSMEERQRRAAEYAAIAYPNPWPREGPIVVGFAGRSVCGVRDGDRWWRCSLGPHGGEPHNFDWPAQGERDGPAGGRPLCFMGRLSPARPGISPDTMCGRPPEGSSACILTGSVRR